MTQPTPRSSLFSCDSILFITSIPGRMADRTMSALRALRDKISKVVSSVFTTIVSFVKKCFCMSPSKTGSLDSEKPNWSEVNLAELFGKSEQFLRALVAKATEDVAKMPEMDFIKNAKSSAEARLMLAELLVWRVFISSEGMKGMPNASIIDLINEAREKFFRLPENTRKILANHFIGARFPSLKKPCSEGVEQEDYYIFLGLQGDMERFVKELKNLSWFVEFADALRVKTVPEADGAPIQQQSNPAEQSDDVLLALVKKTIDSQKQSRSMGLVKNEEHLPAAQSNLAHLLVWRLIMASNDVEEFAKGTSLNIDEIKISREMFLNLSEKTQKILTDHFMSAHLLLLERSSMSGVDAKDRCAAEAVYSNARRFAQKLQKFSWFNACVDAIRPKTS